MANELEEAAAGTDTTPEEALSWLDSAIAEFEGALTACGDHVQAGTLELERVQAKTNGLFIRMMNAATQAEAAAAAGGGS